MGDAIDSMTRREVLRILGVGASAIAGGCFGGEHEPHTQAPTANGDEPASEPGALGVDEHARLRHARHRLDAAEHVHDAHDPFASCEHTCTSAATAHEWRAG